MATVAVRQKNYRPHIERAVGVPTPTGPTRTTSMFRRAGILLDTGPQRVTAQTAPHLETISLADAAVTTTTYIFRPKHLLLRPVIDPASTREFLVTTLATTVRGYLPLRAQLMIQRGMTDGSRTPHMKEPRIASLHLSEV